MKFGNIDKKDRCAPGDLSDTELTSCVEMVGPCSSLLRVIASRQKVRGTGTFLL